METEILVTNIQRFSLHDGPGIRTTVFLKGCSLCCPWCSNPENISGEIQPFVKNGENGSYGVPMTGEDLFREILKDKLFYGETETGEAKAEFCVTQAEELKRLPGGATFSGGEPLLQIQSLEDVLRKLQEEGVHKAVETSLFVSADQLNVALRYIDLFYVDVKILDSAQCKNVLSGALDTYLSNLEVLFSWRDEAGRPKPIIFRIPVIGGYTDTEENRSAVCKLVVEYKPLKAELIRGHNLGEKKYESLGMPVPDYKVVPDAFLKEYAQMIQTTGTATEICRV